ncbi:MAG: hypothetical protein M1335_05630 [Chloroflexi bacterium]|nr:hypothetical protein [Chloroflexota bacterium]
MEKFEKAVGIVALVAMVITPFAAMAQITGGVGAGTIPALPNSPVTSVQGGVNVLGYVINWLITIFWILTVLFLVWAAVLYLTAGGDSEKVDAAKKRVIAAVIAAAIALLSTGLQSIVGGVLSQGH